MTVIDVHTHMLNDEWVNLIAKHGERYTVKELGGQRVIHMDGAPFMTLLDNMFDYTRRIENMDKAGVDMAIVSLTCPSVYWGGEDLSSRTAQLMNDDMAGQQRMWPDRIRHFATLPWQYPQAAVAELARACEKNAVGVFVSANVSGMSLTDERFVPVWEEINRRGLPVLIHPTAPPGTGEMDVFEYNLIASMGFMFDTSLAVSRMIFDGFLDRYTDLKIIAGHGGGFLPYQAGRLDICYKTMPPCREKISRPPSTYLSQIYYDTVIFTQGALDLCVNVGGADNVLYGSDYPHNIGDMSGCLGRVDSLPAADRKRIRGENAIRIFGL